MINKIPFLGWVLSFLTSVSLSIPFWIIWTLCGIGRTYFTFVPELYQSIPFWNCVGLFMVVGILKAALTPQFVSVSQTNNSK